jgi:hypothetical protein
MGDFDPRQPWFIEDGDPNTPQLSKDLNNRYNPHDDQWDFARRRVAAERIEVARRVLMPTYLVLGLFGNTMVLAIITRPWHKRSPIDFFLLMLALANQTVLVFTHLPVWLQFQTGVDLFDMSDFTCKIQMYMGIVGFDCGVLTLVAMTTQRVVSVTWPHRVTTLCSAGRVHGVMAAIAAFCLLLHAHRLYGFAVVRLGESVVMCSHVSEAYMYAEFALNKASLIVFMCVMVLMLVGNTVMVVKLREAVSHLNPTLHLFFYLHLHLHQHQHKHKHNLPAAPAAVLQAEEG